MDKNSSYFDDDDADWMDDADFLSEMDSAEKSFQSSSAVPSSSQPSQKVPHSSHPYLFKRVQSKSYLSEGRRRLELDGRGRRLPLERRRTRTVSSVARKLNFFSTGGDAKI